MKFKEIGSRRVANISTIEETLSDFLDSYDLEKKYNQAVIMVKWEQIVGATVATRTQKITFNDSTMYVYLTSAPLKHQLSQSKSKLIGLINEALKKNILNEIVFM